jgi:hypothetical protein
MTQIQHDKELIAQLGGPSQVARLLGFDNYGAQRVQNWLVRGIPSRIKLDFPKIFLKTKNSGTKAKDITKCVKNKSKSADRFHSVGAHE